MERAGRGYPVTMPSDDEPAVVTPYEDGPLVVRGRFELLDQQGRPIDAGRKTVALCRCGHSASKPFCDSTHKKVRFRAPSGRESG